MTRKLLSLSLCAFLICSMFAGFALADGAEPAKLTIFSGLNEKSANTVSTYEDVVSMAEMEKILNIDVEWMHPPIGQETESFNLMVASLDLPDLIYWGWNNYPGGPEKAVLDGVVVDLKGYLDQMPNLKSVFDTYPEAYKQAVTDEGTLFTAPFIRGVCLDEEMKIHNRWYGPAYRKDWADKLGIETPVTLDDWHDMLVAFRDNIEGCIPFTAQGAGGLGDLAAAFGTQPGFYMDGDKINYGLLSDKYKAWVELMAQWYAEGLIDADYMATDGSSKKAKVTNGEAGCYIGSQGGNWVTYSKVLEQTDPDAKLEVLAWPVGPDGNAYTSQLAARNIIDGGTGLSMTPKCQNTEAALRYMDFGYGEEGLILLTYGIEGETYVINDKGQIEWTPEFQQECEEKGTDYALCRWAFGGASSWATIQGTEDLMRLTRIYPGQYESVFTWGAASDALCVPPLSPTTDESVTLADIMNQVNTYRDEMINKIIMGQLPLEEYDTVVENAKKMGLEDAVAIENAALERYNNR